MQKAIKDLAIGDRVQLVEPDSTGEITKVEPCYIVEGANTLIEWQRTDNNKIGQDICNGNDKVQLA